MFQDISELEIQGANFTTITQLPIFYNLTQSRGMVNAVILFGRNGSGKSTIARAFSKLKGNGEPTIQTAHLIDTHGSIITLTEQDKLHTFILNEDFINRNVRIAGDGLEAIVMLGEQIELTDLIDIATRELETAQAEQESKRILAEEYHDASNEKSPKFYLERIKSALKRDEGWAGRTLKIEHGQGRKVKPPVSDDTYIRLINLTPVKSRDELIIDFDMKFRELEAAQNGTSKIITVVPTVPEINFDIQTVNELLQRNIEHPELSRREEYLLSLVHDGHGYELQRTAQEFSDSQVAKCPKCYQPLTEQYKTDLIASIKKVLSDEVEKYQQSLEAHELQEIVLDMSPFRELGSYQYCIDRIAIINQIIQRNNAIIQARSKNPYTSATEELICFAEDLSILEELLLQLEKKRVKHNKSVTDTAPIIQELNKINDEIAYYDVIEDVRKLEAQKVAQKIADDSYHIAVIKTEEQQRKLDELNARRKNIHVAIDMMNEWLEYIFFSENRMYVKVENNVYKLFCNGHPVKPQNVSCGERNIIGLCYFFISILQGKNRLEAYKEEYLLVIDDPISSYDYDNKIGILSYLKYQLGRFLLGNKGTKLLIMTHDLSTALNIDRIYEELSAECNKNISYTLLELTEKNIKKFPKKRDEYNEYTEMLKLIYEYGNGKASEHEIYIGNIMRQVIEAFSTFEFKQGIGFSRDDSILSAIEHEKTRDYFKNLMYRFVLNGGSHRREQTQSMNVNFFMCISEQEKRRIARDLLCFMYCLNKPHMKAHLGEEKCKDIQEWYEKITIQN